MDRFPVETSVRYDYASRFDPRPGGHHGTDIFAPAGTPVYAVEDGDATADEDPTGGHVVYLYNSKAVRYYYYAHLQDIDPSIPKRPKTRRVSAGTLLGHVGTSGNARNTPPHLHFQYKWRGNLVNPYDALSAVDPKKTGVPPVAKPDKPSDKPKPKVPGKEFPDKPPAQRPGTIVLTDESGKESTLARALELGILALGAYLIWNWSQSKPRRRARG